MSELKARRAYFSEDEYERGEHKICAKISDCGYDRKNDWWSYAFEDEVYLKSEADTVIAEKDEAIDELEERIDELQKATDSAWSKVNVMYDELRHQKYKRCFDKAKLCKRFYEELKYSPNYLPEFDAPLLEHYSKWHKRWLELAEKFKPNNTTAQ